MHDIVGGTRAAHPRRDRISLYREQAGSGRNSERAREEEEPRVTTVGQGSGSTEATIMTGAESASGRGKRRIEAIRRRRFFILWPTPLSPFRTSDLAFFAANSGISPCCKSKPPNT